MKFKKARKLLALLLVMVMTLSLLPAPMVVAAESDISGHWAEETVQKWVGKGWFNGDDSGTYRPDDGITRAEFMALVNRMKDYKGQSQDINKYRDISSDEWFYDVVSAALDAGYIKGSSDTTMSPYSNITRQEAMTIIARFSGVSAENTDILSVVSDGDQVADWALETVAACINEGLVAGYDGKINPTSNITRAEAVVLLDRCDSNTRMYGFPGTYGSKSAITTASDIIIGAPGVKLSTMDVSGNLTINKAVGEGDAHLDNIKVKGDLLVEGGGKNSVHFNAVTVEGSVFVRKYQGENKVRIVVSGKSKLNVVVLETGTILVSQELADGAIASIVIPAKFLRGSVFEFVGDFEYIENNGRLANIIINGHVKTLKLNAPAKITGKGTIDEIVADDDVLSKSTIELNKEDSGQTGNSDIDALFKNTGGGGNNGGNTPSQDVTVASVPLVEKTVKQNDTSYSLPTEVAVRLSNNNTQNMGVTWSPNAADTSKCGVFDFEGTLVMSGSITNPNDVKAALKLTVEPVIDKIKIEQLPAKLDYLVGEELDLSGLIVQIIYTDGDTEIADIDSDSVTGFDSSSAGQKTVTITVEGKTATFDVSIYQTAEGTLAEIPAIKPITDVANGAPATLAGLKLPGRIPVKVVDFTTDNSIVITTDNSVVTLVDVDWNLNGISYNPSIKTEQTFTVNGLVNLDGTDITNDLSKNLSVSIQITVLAAKYTVTFSLNGQSGATIPKQTVSHGKLAITPVPPTLTAYNFKGWFKEPACTTPWDFATDVVTANTTLYAKWEIKTFTITFNSNGFAAAMPGNLTVEYGKKAVKPTDPTLTDYEFRGWYTDVAHQNLYNWDVPVTKDMTLYAYYTIPMEIEGRDARFAVGYPIVDVLSDGRLEIQLKLDKTPTSPIQAYIVVDSFNARYITPSVQDVIHGHTGNGKRQGETNIEQVSATMYAELKNNDVLTLETVNQYFLNNPILVGIVLVENNALPNSVTLVTIGTSKENEYPPWICDAYINEDRNKIVVYLDEELKTTVPKPEAKDFEFTVGGETTSNIVITDIDIQNRDGEYWHLYSSWIELTVTGVKAEHLTEGLEIQYNPGENPIQGMSGNKIKDPSGFIYVSEILEDFTAYINPREGTMRIVFEPGFFLENENVITPEMFTLKNGNTEVEILEIYCYDYYDACEILFSVEPFNNPGLVTFSFEPNGKVLSLAFDPVSDFIDKSVIVIEKPYESVTAWFYDAFKMISVELEDAKILYNYNLANCNFILTVDEKEYTLRGFGGYYEDVDDLLFEIYLDENIIEIIEAGTNVSIRYQNTHNTTNIHWLLRDKSGALVPPFSDIPVATAFD